MNTRLMMVALFCIGLAMPSLFAAEPIGSIVLIQGKAVAVNAQGQERKLALKSPVFMNDKIITRAGGKLQLMK